MINNHKCADSDLIKSKNCSFQLRTIESMNSLSIMRHTYLKLRSSYGKLKFLEGII